MSKPILCLDFDGVIHSYTSSWKGVGVAEDPPVPGVADWIEKAARHFEIAVYSSRSSSFPGRRCMKRYIASLLSGREGLDDRDNTFVPLASLVRYPWFKPSAFLTIDDRAMQFQGNWFSFGPERLRNFKPWNK